jgi:hypothetical protein
MTLNDFNFDQLPEVQQALPDTAASRLPRFEGDVSELPNQACWALQNLLTRRYVSKETHPDLWVWIIDHRRALASRLSELDLKLRIHEDLEVAYTEQAQPDTKHLRSRTLLRREPMRTYSTLLAMHLASIARTNRADQLLGRDDIHELFSTRHKKDRDETMLASRIDDAIAKMVQVKILLPSSNDSESFSISPVILGVMTGQLVDELTKEFERQRRDVGDDDSAANDDAGDSAEDIDTDEWDGDESGEPGDE